MRELKHQVSRAMLLCQGGHVTAADLALPMQRVAEMHNRFPSTQSAEAGQTSLNAAEKALILQALADARNNVSQAARLLGITRMTMRYRIDKHSIKHY